MPRFQKRKVTENVHGTRITSRRNRDRQGLTVPSDVNENRAKQGIGQNRRSAFTRGKQQYPNDTLERN